MELSNRIKQRRKDLGITQEELARRLGYSSRSTIAKIESGENDITQSKIEDFAKALDTTIASLMGWGVKSYNPFSHPEVFPLERKRVPLLGDIACGEPILASQEYDEYVETGTYVNADFAVRAAGDSMVGARILDGDIVFIREQPTVQNGEIAAVVINDSVTLKRFRQVGELIILRPENSLYEDIIINLQEEENVRILGKAIAFHSNLY